MDNDGASGFHYCNECYRTDEGVCNKECASCHCSIKTNFQRKRETVSLCYPDICIDDSIRWLPYHTLVKLRTLFEKALRSLHSFSCIVQIFEILSEKPWILKLGISKTIKYLMEWFLKRIPSEALFQNRKYLNKLLSVAMKEKLPLLCCSLERYVATFPQISVKGEISYNDLTYWTYNRRTLTLLNSLIRYITEDIAKIRGCDGVCCNIKDVSFLCCANGGGIEVYPHLHQREVTRCKDSSYWTYNRRTLQKLPIRYIIEDIEKIHCCDLSDIKDRFSFFCCATGEAVGIYQLPYQREETRCKDPMWTYNHGIPFLVSHLCIDKEVANTDSSCQVMLIRSTQRIENSNWLLFSVLVVLEYESDYEIILKTRQTKYLLLGISNSSLPNGMKALSYEQSILLQCLTHFSELLSVQLEIRNTILNMNCFSELIYTSDLFRFKEFLSNHLSAYAKLKPIKKMIYACRTVPKKDNTCVLFKMEKTLRRTAIIQVCQEKTISSIIKFSDFDLNAISKKSSVLTPKNEHSSNIRILVKKSLAEMGYKPVPEKSSIKDTADFGIRHTNVELVVYPVSRNALDYTFEQIVAGKSQHSSDIMRFEMQRFASFANYNFPDAPSAFEFAKAGWYATGLGKETACFICDVKFSEWRKNLKPLDVHAQLSPGCPFIKGEDVEAVSVDRVTHQNASEHSSQNTRRDFESITNGVEEINLTETTNSATNLNPHGFSNNQVSAQRNGHYVNGFADCRPSDILSFQTPINDQTDHLSNAEQSNGYHLYNRSLLSNGEVSVDNPSRSFASSELLPNSSNGLSPGHSDRHSIIDTGRPYSNNYHHQNNYQFVPFTADLPQQQPLPLNEYYSPPPMSAFGTPKFPAYLALNVRISSYQGFPSHTGQSPRVLAQAGMFYRGYSDRCSCFWCGIGLQNWSMEDDPWVEHARWSPRCQYLIDSKGEEFIALVQESYRQEDPIFPEINDDDVMIADLQSMGFLTESIQSAIKTLKKNGRNVNLQIVANFLLENMFTEPQAQVSAVDVTNDKPPSEFENKAQSNIGKVNIVTSNKNEMSQDKINSLDENSKSMYEETTAMKEQLTCKVCMDNSVSVVFLPCGHIVACGVCSVRLSKCPICRKFIREKVKTLMA